MAAAARMGAANEVAWQAFSALLAGLLALSSAAGRDERMTIVEDGKSRWHISLQPGAGETERFAVEEIARYIDQMTGVRLPIAAEQSPTLPAIALRCQGGESGTFAIVARAQMVDIRGDGSVGCLHGAYELLERWGCRWFYPGVTGEVVPSRTRLELTPFESRQAPSFPSRSFILSGEPHVSHLAEWIDWSGKQRINNLFLHGHWPAEEHFGELAKRGITLEGGGHQMPGLLPRSLFSTHPEYFREVNGRRVKRHNFCPSSPGARQVVRANARKHFLAHPGMAFYHVWPDDLWQHGWCSCRECSGLSPSDQALQAANLVAEVLEGVYPGARLAYLAYHDTMKPPDETHPRDNVFLLNAPRERCYAHAMDDPDCLRNRGEYRPAWQRLRELFEKDGRRNSHAFEYYSDTILFRSMQPPLLTVITADARYYRSLNLPVYQSLVVSTRDWHSPPFSLYLFARAAWNAQVDGNQLVADYCRHYFGPAAETVESYFHALDGAFQLILAFDAYEGRIHDLRQPASEPEAAGRQKLSEIERAMPLLSRAGDLLREAAKRTHPGPYADRLQREQEIWEITTYEVTALHAQLASPLWLREYHESGDDSLRQRTIAVAEKGLHAIEQARQWMSRFPENEPNSVNFDRIHDHQAKALEAVGRLKDLRKLTVFDAEWMLSPGARVEGEEVHTASAEDWQPEGLFTPAPVNIPESGVKITYRFLAERMGRDSQALFSTDGVAVAYRFCVFPQGRHFVLYTAQEGQWAPRVVGGRPQVGRPYSVTVLLRPTSIAVTVEDEAGTQVWASGDVMMDEVTRTGLGFLDAEPEAGATATRWQAVHLELNEGE